MRLFRSLVFGLMCAVLSTSSFAEESFDEQGDFAARVGNISFYNHCHKPIMLSSIVYNANQGRWYQDVFITFQVAQIYQLGMTIREFYFYARSLDGTIVWTGNDHRTSVVTGQYNFRKARVTHIGQFTPFRIHCDKK